MRRRSFKRRGRAGRSRSRARKSRRGRAGRIKIGYRF